MGYLIDTGFVYKETILIREPEVLDLGNTPVVLFDSPNNLGFFPIVLAANIYLDNSSVGYGSYQHFWLNDAGAAIKAVIDESAVGLIALNYITTFSVDAWNPPGTKLGAKYDPTRALNLSCGNNPVGDGNIYITLLYYKMPLI